MSPLPARRRIPRWRASLALIVPIALGLILLLVDGLPGPVGASRAAGQSAATEVSAQTDDSAPGRGIVMLGSASSGETWGISELGAFGGGSWGLVRYVQGAGWSVSPWLRADGQPPSEVVLKPDNGPLTGEIAPNGAGAMLGTITPESGGPERQVLLARAPGGVFQEAPAVTEEGEGALLRPGESLFSRSRAPLLAALGEPGGQGGALVVPVNSNPSGVEEDGVLHWDGHQWTREQIEVPPTSKEHQEFRVLAIGASSPTNAWLLGQLSQQASAGAVALFRRHLGASGTPTWQPVAPAPAAKAGEPLKVPVVQASATNEVPFTVSGIGEPPTATAQILTVTEEGLWIDGEAKVGENSGLALTMFFKPEGEEPSRGRASASWCPAGGAGECTHAVEDPLPTGPSRSFAWADPSNPEHFGQRVIAGLAEGVSLRLEGSSFARVLALGSGEQSFQDVGGSRGAAFSSPREGWLGNERMPVHLTQRPAPNRLQPYPVPFRQALLAVAPQPGAAAAALSSQALAVGDDGEVARYTPGEGWQPESLFGSGGRVVRPPLRAVAWPTPTRAYAVGQLDQRGDPEMWLWRGETGLWEPDPGAPLNFRGELLGIAFDPSNPTRGYAVGQQGVLLRYGKSWTQDALPPEVQGASFTSIAFAGSEAIVAFRLPHPQVAGEGAHYTGGVLVNGGSGWHVDQGAGAALAGGVPWAVAGLGDGGAAISGVSRHEEPLVLERNGAGGAWEPTPVQYPGFEPPGSLALFREGGALRAIGSAAIPDTAAADFSEHPPPAGFPPTLVKPYLPVTGYVRRQTAVGWSDEEHDRNEIGPPRGEPRTYDLPYRPDPTAAVLVDPSGSQGWAVGGQLDTRGRLDTADVARYPADGSTPPGVGRAPVGVNCLTAPSASLPCPSPANPFKTAFAVGGNAQCAAPCAERANDRLGPDVWLSSALEQAGQIAGLQAFLYTGPRVTSGEGRVSPTPVPRVRELGRYAALLSVGALPRFAAPSPTDLGGGECRFQEAFSSFPAPFGAGELSQGSSRSTEPCGEGQSSYYAFDSSGAGGSVRVIVLDDVSEPGQKQLEWLAGELSEAATKTAPAIVVGNAPPSPAVAQTLIGGNASAYFYDSPEQNVLGHLGSSSIPTLGSGTLGYGSSINAERQEFIGHAGFLLAEVGALDPKTGRSAVTPRLIPNIGELAMEAKDGVLLHRSQPALFDALARRARAGCLAVGSETHCETSPYIPLPANCVGTACASAIFPEYSFSSSRPDFGDFVKPNLASPDPHAVLLGPNGTPIHDSTSGLFCAYNAGTTIVTISAGGLSASLPVTVQAGSVRRPCGTQPLQELPAQQTASAAAPPPAPTPAPTGGPAPASAAPAPVPVPAAPAPTPPTPTPTPTAPLFFAPVTPPSPLLAALPPPVPTPARPTPPSGTSAVTQPVEAPEREEEEEEATESVGAKALAYHAPEHEPSPAYILGIVLLAAFAEAAIRRPGRGRRELRVAPATLTMMRTQRRINRRR